MTAAASMGNFIIALPPSDIWLTDDQAAEFLSYEKGYFKASIICLKGFPKPKYITETTKGRRWNLKKLSDLARMIGHKDLRSLMIYYNATASEIANRLD